ncbi:hypothetical protein FOMPIDRAFT_1021625 [Fomitopsis schrenkii]|uniref:Uncharacterized protein n=1 Tax=Fomitopsis schrenkii TaxID=2126942 RepID=S8G3C1_FOMSC|nr:hypothetical protein FOMPIDRAFT_1021625 [Fomitopsis schrenkii]
MTRALDSRSLYGSRVCAIVGDLIVMVLTWYKTSESGHRLQVFCLRHLIRGRSGPTLADLLVRDGFLCFLVLLILNVVQMVTARQIAYGVIEVFVTAMMSTLVSRLLINLNEMFNKDVRIVPFSHVGTPISPSTAPSETEDVATIMFASLNTDQYLGSDVEGCPTRVLGTQ